MIAKSQSESLWGEHTEKNLSTHENIIVENQNRIMLHAVNITIKPRIFEGVLKVFYKGSVKY